ncbi:MAG: ribbon-helix-helix domain-containing protein [Nanoarchaeota archaeon]|nr:ribbon-helix-helix domain-containing protein [Nanoarchaeota archaeon]
MIPVQVRFTKKLIELLDELVDKGVYSNRSEAVRDATRKLVITSNDTVMEKRKGI